MDIRAYQVKDEAEVIQLWQECGLCVPQNDPVKDIQRKLLTNPELFLVGFEDKQIVATVMGGFEGHRGWINYLAVKTSSQGQGYAQDIMSAIESLLKACGCPKINLQVRATNEKVIAFYESIGYSNDHVVGMGKRLVID